MDIWHRIGRVVRLSNLGILVFFALNIALIISAFGASGNIGEVVKFYNVIILIGLLPLRKRFLDFIADAQDIKRTDIKLRIITLAQYALDRAKQETLYNLDSLNVMTSYNVR